MSGSASTHSSTWLRTLWWLGIVKHLSLCSVSQNFDTPIVYGLREKKQHSSHMMLKESTPPLNSFSSTISIMKHISSPPSLTASSLPLKKYARGYLPSLPIFYVFAKRGENIKDTFGQRSHWKLARRAGRTSCTPCSLVSCSHARCSHRNHSFLTCNSFTSFSVLILLNHDK